MTMLPTIYVVEDDPGMRDALALLLQSADFNPESYPSAEMFLAEVPRSQPICLLTDVRLPGMDGIALYQHLASLGLDPAAVIITAHGDIPMAVSALKDGAVDFLEKPFDPAMLLDSVREAWEQAAARQQRKSKVAEVVARRSTLTPREAEILTLVAEGHANKVIASRLGMSIRTTEHHRAHIMEKMGVRSLHQLVNVLSEAQGLHTG